jgi:hypothetical protein
MCTWRVTPARERARSIWAACSLLQEQTDWGLHKRRHALFNEGESTEKVCSSVYPPLVIAFRIYWPPNVKASIPNVAMSPFRPNDRTAMVMRSILSVSSFSCFPLSYAHLFTSFLCLCVSYNPSLLLRTSSLDINPLYLYLSLSLRFALFPISLFLPFNIFSIYLPTSLFPSSVSFFPAVFHYSCVPCMQLKARDVHLICLCTCFYYFSAFLSVPVSSFRAFSIPLFHPLHVSSISLPTSLLPSSVSHLPPVLPSTLDVAQSVYGNR